MAVRRPFRSARATGFRPGAAGFALPGAAGFVVPGLAVLAFIAPFPSTATLSAQQWSASVDAGRATFDVGARDIETSNFVVGVQYAAPALWFGASMSPAVSGDDPLWGGLWAAASPTIARGPWTAALDVGGQFYGQDDPTGLSSGVGAGGEVLPRLAYRLDGVWEVGASGGGQAYYSGFGTAGSEFTRTVGILEGTLTATPREAPIQVGASVRHVFAEEDGYTFVGARALAARRRVLAWVGAGTWLHEFIDTTPWDVGAAVRVSERVWARASAERQAFDPVYLSDARTAWSVGLSLTLQEASSGAEIADVQVPVRSSATPVEVRLPRGAAPEPPSVAGDFSGWEPRPMRLDGEDWVFRTPLAPGVYHYAFVDARGEWFVPEGTPGRTPDGMGGWVAVLIVEE